MTVYTLNLRVFWTLFICFFLACLLLRHHGQKELTSGLNGCPDRTLGPLLLIKVALAFVICYIVYRYCSYSMRRIKRCSSGAPEVLCSTSSSRKELLEDYYERRVRLSPHVLGHSKAHVAKLVTELVRAGRTETPSLSSISLRGDFVQIGSSYEEHKVGRPDCFDILVPLRLPHGLKLEPAFLCGQGRPLHLCNLETPCKSGWIQQHRAFTGTFLSCNKTRSVHRLSPSSVLRWFYPVVQRCLAAVRYTFEWHCSLGLSMCNDRIMLHLTPHSDYMCCHISMGVRLIPAVPLQDGAYLVPAALGLQQGDFWMPYFPRQEQRLLGWLRSRVPPGSCHLKCLQIAKALRDLGGQALGGQGGAEWGRVLSSYFLKTVWLRLLLSLPQEAWGEYCLLSRVEDLLKSLQDSLQQRELRHLFLGGDTGLLPSFVTLPKIFRDKPPSNLLAGFSPRSLDLVSARLSYCWAHLHRLIRLGCPQRGVTGRGVHYFYLGSE